MTPQDIWNKVVALHSVNGEIIQNIKEDLKENGNIQIQNRRLVFDESEHRFFLKESCLHVDGISFFWKCICNFFFRHFLVKVTK